MPLLVLKKSHSSIFIVLFATQFLLRNRDCWQCKPCTQWGEINNIFFCNVYIVMPEWFVHISSLFQVVLEQMSCVTLSFWEKQRESNKVETVTGLHVLRCSTFQETRVVVFIHLNNKGASVLSFPLCTLHFQLLFVSFLLFQIFLHSHSQASKARGDRKHYIKPVNITALYTKKCICRVEDCAFIFILPPGLLFLHIFPAALHESKCIVTFIPVSEEVK